MRDLALLGGWALATLAGLAALVVRRELVNRRETIVRACHELRGPLTSVRLGLQLAARNGQLDTPRLSALDLELARAALALEDLSDPRSDGATLRSVRRVDLRRIVADTVEAFGAGGSTRGARLEANWSGPDVWVWGDRLRLAQAVANLVANAVEHGGGPIEVTGRSERDRARIEVADGGSGLPEPVASLVDRARNGRGQRGRGLAIAAAIVEAHGGRLAAAPTERGARLVLELPAVVSPSLAPVAR